VASGNLLADFRANAAAEAQGRVQTARLYNMSDDPGVRNVLKFNLARDTLHKNLWLKAIEELQVDRLETTVALFDEEYAEHATSVWRLDHLLVGHGLMAHQGRRPRSDAVGRRHVAYRTQRR
jgi:Mn-containing catalase